MDTMHDAQQHRDVHGITRCGLQSTATFDARGGRLTPLSRFLVQIMALNPSCCGEAEPGPDDLVIHHRNYKDELTSDQYARLHFKVQDSGLIVALCACALRGVAVRQVDVWWTAVGVKSERNARVCTHERLASSPLGGLRATILIL